MYAHNIISRGATGVNFGLSLQLLYIRMVSVRTARSLVRVRAYRGSTELLLLAYAISKTVAETTRLKYAPKL